MLRDEGVHRRHAGDVEDRDLGARLDDLLQQRLHDDLRPRGVEGADHRQGEDAVPQLHDRRGQFEHLLLLPDDNFLACPLMDLGRVQAEVVE